MGKKSAQALWPTIFCDRDGVLNKLLVDKPPESYIHRWDQIEFCDGVIPALAKVFQSRYKFLIVSNQSGISRWPDRMPYKQIDEIFKNMVSAVEIQVYEMNRDTPPTQKFPDEYNHVIDGYMFCPHLPEHECNCRKPKPGMIHALGILHEAHFKQSWMIGDSIVDVKAGWNAGIRNNIFLDEKEAPTIFDNEGRLKQHNHNQACGIYAHDLSNAIDFILEHDRLEAEGHAR